MQPQFTPYLTVALAIGLGFAASRALQSTPAEGYPMGAVSLGANPIEMAAGSVVTSPATVFTATSEYDFVVTDVVVSLGHSGRQTCVTRVVLTNGAGTQVGAFQLQTDAAQDYNNNPGATASVISHAFSSGLVLSPDDSMTISRSSECGSVAYTLSGYHAKL